MLAQGRFWRISLTKGEDAIVLGLHREMVPEELREIRELTIEVPLERWNRVVKHVRSDRKLVGGILLDFAKNKDHVSAAIANDRLFFELQSVVLDATTSLVERGSLVLTLVDVGVD